MMSNTDVTFLVDSAEHMRVKAYTGSSGNRLGGGVKPVRSRHVLLDAASLFKTKLRIDGYDQRDAFDTRKPSH